MHAFEYTNLQKSAYSDECRVGIESVELRGNSSESHMDEGPAHDGAGPTHGTAMLRAASTLISLSTAKPAMGLDAACSTPPIACPMRCPRVRVVGGTETRARETRDGTERCD